MRNSVKYIALGLGLLVTACGPRNYYIPVDNKLGNAAPLTKNDIVRIIIPHDFPGLVEKIQENGKDWTEYLKASMYEMSAKKFTEERLQSLGYQVIDLENKKPKSNKKPTVIGLIYAYHDRSKDHDLVEISQSPAMTDEFGKPTFWNTDEDIIPIKQIVYKVKLIRPQGKDNPLFNCDETNPLSKGYCIAPENLENYSYQTISDDYGTMDTSAKDPVYILDHLTTGVLYDYPNLLGKKRVFLYTQPIPQVFKVIDEPPAKKK